MIEAGIIEPIEEFDWVNLMVVQEKKQKGKIRICIDLWKLNDACVHDPFPTLFIEEVLDNVGGQEAYSFTEGVFEEYDFEVIVKPGRLNVGPNHLSRIETCEEPSSLEERLPDAQLFVVGIANAHFADIFHFLTMGMAPERYTSQQKKELVVHVAEFLVIVRHLYKMGEDEILRRYVLDFEHDSILA
eukprot:PITA_01736